MHLRSLVDPEATWYIKASRIRALVSRLEPPLGIGQSSTRESIQKVLNDSCLLEIPVNSEGMVNIVHVATSLAKRLAKQVRSLSPFSFFSCVFWSPGFSSHMLVFNHRNKVMNSTSSMILIPFSNEF
mmetsp:Transcript_18455/g.53216  ORF Transcript_18455/g.53216 Transcript_18455/m.53216 type:complete len:127 (-) Transcript_18455:944-1324(-)